MKTVLKLLLIAFITSTAVRMMFVARLQFANDPSVSVTPLNFPLPDAPLPKWDDSFAKVTGKDFPDHPVLIVFFGSWCPPCLVEYAALSEIAGRKDAADIIGIAVRDTPENIRRLFETKGRVFTETLMDAEDKWARAFDAARLPAAYLTDGRGNVVYKFNGLLNNDFYENVLLPLIRERNGDVAQ